MLEKNVEEKQKKKQQSFTLTVIKLSDRPIGMKTANIIPGSFTGIT